MLLPAYNAGRYIDQAIESILNQTFRDLELIVIDDGSRDDTLARIQAHAGRDSRVRVVTRENRGLIATLNEGIALARADLIARMDADDIAYPERLERQVKTFRDTPGLGLCGTAVDTLFKDRIFRGKPVRLLTEGSPGILSIFYTMFFHPTLMIDRRVAGDQLMYDPSYPHAEDFDLIRRLAERFPIAYLPEPLLAYRQHEGSVTVVHRRVMRQTHMRIVRENLTAYGFTGDLEALSAFADEITPETVRRAGAVMADVRAQFRQRDPAQVASYELGWTGLFFLMHAMFIDASETSLLRDFLNMTDGWSQLRRREQMFLKLTHANSGLAIGGLKASYALQAFVSQFGSIPLSDFDRVLSSRGI